MRDTVTHILHIFTILRLYSTYLERSTVIHVLQTDTNALFESCNMATESSYNCIDFIKQRITYESRKRQFGWTYSSDGRLKYR